GHRLPARGALDGHRRGDPASAGPGGRRRPDLLDDPHAAGPSRRLRADLAAARSAHRLCDGGRPRVRRLVLVTVLLGAAVGLTSAQEPSPATLEALRQRLIQGVTATVEGRIYMEGRKPNDPPEPLVGIGVLIVPRSRELLDELERLKRQARESVNE